MEPVEHFTKSTAAELGLIWSQYISDSMSKYIFEYFLSHVQDEEIKDVLQYAYELTDEHLVKLNKFFTQENNPIPIGFTEDDVSIGAPRLFSDTYIIVYIQTMAIHGLTRYSGAIGSSLREDYIKYFNECSNESIELYSRACKILLYKGIISKPPVFHNKYEIDLIDKQSYMTGWLGERRPISAVEINGTYLNLQKTMMKIVLEIGFSQVARSKEVRKYMERSRQVCQKHLDRLTKMLKKDNLHIPRTFESEVTDSTVPPFSDKLMMFLITSLLSSAIAYYGEALALCQRRDLSISYARMIAEIGVLAEDGMNLLIKNGWMEQPPIATDHKKLYKKK